MLKFRPLLASFAFFALSFTPVLAQLEIGTNPAINDTLDHLKPDNVAYSSVTNTHSDSITVFWFRNVIELPEDWETAICDRNICHFPWVGTQSFELAEDESGSIDVHLYSNGNTGSNAIVEVKLVTDVNPTDTVSITFLFYSTLGTVERLYQKVNVYPNPTADRLWIEAGSDIQRVEVYNIQGVLVKQQLLNGKSAIEMADLPKGAYVLRLSDSAMQLVSSNVVIRN